MKLELKEFEEKMKKSVAGLESEYATISAGRASASVLDRVQVEYFGSNMPVNQVAEIKMPGSAHACHFAVGRFVLKEYRKGHPCF